MQLGPRQLAAGRHCSSPPSPLGIDRFLLPSPSVHPGLVVDSLFYRLCSLSILPLYPMPTLLLSPSSLRFACALFERDSKCPPSLSTFLIASRYTLTSPHLFSSFRQRLHIPALLERPPSHLQLFVLFALPYSFWPPSRASPASLKFRGGM